MDIVCCSFIVHDEGEEEEEIELGLNKISEQFSGVDLIKKNMF